MIKITTLFKKNPENLWLVINEVNPDNQWVLDWEWIPTKKIDGTATAIIGWELYKRYDAKKGKSAPEWAIPCQEADPITWHHPHWVKCSREKKEDRYFFEWFDCLNDKVDGTYELIGEKVQWNLEKVTWHILVRHGSEILTIPWTTFDLLKKYLSDTLNDIEWIVFHHKTDGRMCKIRKSDFWVKR